MAFAGVVDWETFFAEGSEEGLDAGNDGANRADVVALALEVAFWRADCKVLALQIVNWGTKSRGKIWKER